MTACCICKTPLKGEQMMCRKCFSFWPKGMTFAEYTSMPYKPSPVVYPRGKSCCEDSPP